MIAYLEGEVLAKKQNYLILKIGNIGYKVFLSAKNLAEVSVGETIELFTFLYHKEDVFELYGTFSLEELEVFEVLNNIQGIGPKVALALATIGSLDSLKKAIESGDTKIFEGVKGIGKKKMQKIILELTGRLKNIETQEKSDSLPEDDSALDALVALGISKTKAKEALKQVPKEGDVQERVKEALKIIGRK